MEEISGGWGEMSGLTLAYETSRQSLTMGSGIKSAMNKGAAFAWKVFAFAPTMEISCEHGELGFPLSGVLS